MDKNIVELIEKDKDETIELVDEMDGKITAKDFFSIMKDDIEAFKVTARQKKTGYHNPKFPSISQGLEGWEPGLYLFAAESNAGKSAFMMNIIEDLCTHEPNKLFGLYFSLDDDKNKIIPRLVAMREGVPIGVVSKPGRYEEMILNNDENSIVYQEWLDKADNGLNKLANDSNKMMVLDSTDIKNIDEMYEYIKQVVNYVKAIDPDNNVVIAIDSIKDVKLSDRYPKMTSNERADEVARTIKEWSIELGLIILASMHLRKLNGNRRPIRDDLKDSNTLEYEASVIWLLFNDVSKNKQAAKIYHRNSDESEKEPILEMDWSKNKVSSYKGRTFNYFSPEFSRAVECGEEASKRFNGLLYEA